MEADLLEFIASLRMTVGFLGEREQFGWWQSSFFTKGSSAFMAPLFPRTKVLAQCNGVTQAAALVHDERIGVGHVYHLFRLPEDMEQGIHQVLHNQSLGEALQKIVASPENALAFLRKRGTLPNTSGVGPIRLGSIEALRSIKTWQSAASYYREAFEKGGAIFPYYSDIQ
jgi:hypothetical protein